ncbi:MAG: hypothetical protein P4M09_06415 [Devosia sp.]|nr:hypothetical protein [Devosia sp.]
MNTYEIARIEPHQVDRAFTLLQVALPAVHVDVWRGYVTDLLNHRRGWMTRDVLVACNARHYLQALCIVSLVERGELRVLDVPIFIVVSAADERGVRAELLAHLKSRAADSGCHRLRIWTQTPDNWALHLAPDAFERAVIDLSVPVLAQ